MSKSNKSYKIQFRISEYEKNKIKMFAEKYADGNLSAWLIYAAINAPRKFISKKTSQPKLESDLK